MNHIRAAAPMRSSAREPGTSRLTRILGIFDDSARRLSIRIGFKSRSDQPNVVASTALIATRLALAASRGSEPKLDGPPDLRCRVSILQAGKCSSVRRPQAQDLQDRFCTTERAHDSVAGVG